MDLFSLKGKKAIVTGGTRGLGYGMAEGLCRAGAEVAILGTSEKVRESADALARTTGVVVHGIVGDLVREEEVTNIYKRLVESLDGQADILVNCAGTPPGRYVPGNYTCSCCNPTNSYGTDSPSEPP